VNEFSEQEKDSFYKAIYSRRDVRSNFTSEHIDEQVLARILMAAHHAPSVGFSQPWNFILVKNIEIRKRIKESFEKEKTRSSNLIEDPKRSKYLSYKLEGILESSINVCVTYDPTKTGSFVIGRTCIPETGIFSVCCAVQNMWLAARTEGIGVGWVSILSNETLRNELQIPDHVVPVAYLCLGHVSKFETKPDLERNGWLPRLKLDDVIYHEKWLQEKPDLDMIKT